MSQLMFFLHHCSHQCMSLHNDTSKHVYLSTELRTWAVGCLDPRSLQRCLSWTLGHYSDYTFTSFGPWVTTMMGSQITCTKHRLFGSMNNKLCKQCIGCEHVLQLLHNGLLIVSHQADGLQRTALSLWSGFILRNSSNQFCFTNTGPNTARVCHTLSDDSSYMWMHILKPD